MKRDDVNVRVDRDLWAKIRAIATAEDRTMHAVVRRLLREALDARELAPGHVSRGS